MQRIVFREYGGPEVLQVEHAPRPEPADDELVIEVAAIGVTLPVVKLSHGNGAGVPLPYAPGGEVVGKVVSIGQGVIGWQIGQRAAGLAFTGAYAEFAAVKASFLAPVPNEVDDTAAVALVRSGQVALGALRVAAFRSGESVLVTAAAGGVGHLAVQLAKTLGASRVIAAVGTDTKTAFLRSLGADQVVRYDQSLNEWGDLVDVVLDGTGGHVQAIGLEHLVPFGRLVSYNANGAMVDANQLRLHARTIIGFAMAHLAHRRPDTYMRHQRELWELHRSGALRPAIHATLPLDQAAQAHRIIESRTNLGKVVLIPGTSL